MLWSIGGVLLWLGGWWFTGRLFGVYSKAIYLEEVDRRREETHPPAAHHTGTAVFVVFDLGLLILGMRSLYLLQHPGGAPVANAVTANAVQWSVLACVYLFREASNLHSFYHDRWRGLSAHPLMQPTATGTLRGLWMDCPPVLRVAFLLAPGMALVPLVMTALRIDVMDTGWVPLVIWFALPQVLLLVALSPPLLRVRRLVRGGHDLG